MVKPPSLADALAHRFGEPVPISVEEHALAGLAAHRSHRAFQDRAIDPELIHMLAAIALSSPTKSDLQQRDIVIVADPDLRRRMDALAATQPWVQGAPAFLLFCGNNRRQRQIHGWRGRAYANDHLDAFFNATVDAAIALAWYVAAAERVGLGTCPVSAVRNRAEEVSALVGLPGHVFPVAGLAVGWPAEEGMISPRLPLPATVHVDRFDERRVREQVDAYDRRRAELQPYASQRFVDEFGVDPAYTWSEDKARQYARPERADFGAFVRARGFNLD